MTTFYKKIDAINYITKSENENLMLLQQDIIYKKDNIGSKQFVVINKGQLNKIYDLCKDVKMSNKRNCNIYESWLNNTKMVFGLDMDITEEYLKKYKPEDLLKDAILCVMDVAEKHYNHVYNMEDILILQNNPTMQRIDNAKKISYHVIFRGLTFENVNVCRDFYDRIKGEGYEMLCCDDAIYRMTCFRLCYNTKINKYAYLEPVQMNIDGEYTMYLKDDYKMWLLSMITYVEPSNRIIGKEMIQNKKSMQIEQIENSMDSREMVTKNKIKFSEIEKILFKLPSNYYTEYDKWLKIGMILNNISEEYKEECYKLWCRWSSQSSKYNEKGMRNKWLSFNNHSGSYVGLGTLIKWAKDENIISKEFKFDMETIIMEYPEKPIYISEESLENAIIINQNKLEAEVFEPHLCNKLLCVQSEKGTGKTFNMLKALFKENGKIDIKNKNILFVSSRRTFGIKLLNDLEEYGFKLYSNIKEGYITDERIICQIDSLLRLSLKKYDIIIIDECESLARYLTSNHFRKNDKANMIINIFENYVKKASNVYVLDADLSERCINYYSNLTECEDDFQLIVNDYRPCKDYTISCMMYIDWVNKIMKDIQHNKKIVVAMASNNKAKDLEKMIRHDYKEKKVLLIHKETSDADKLQGLLRVNEEWIKYDVIIYTPSVCMGVSFDVVEYFDNIYAYGCANSLGSQEFCQMMHRVRNPKNKTIYIAFDTYKQYTDDDIVNYQLVENILTSDNCLNSYDLHNNLMQTNISFEEDVLDLGLINRKVEYKNKNEAFYDLFVRNSWEQIEDKLNMCASFFGYAKYKRYKIEIYNSINNHINNVITNKELKELSRERKNEEKTKEAKNIMNAAEINDDTYKFLIKQKSDNIDEAVIHQMQRYRFITTYNMKDVLTERQNSEKVLLMNDILNEEMIKKYNEYEMMKCYRNLSTIIETEDQTTEEKLKILRFNTRDELYFKTNCYLDFTYKNKFINHYFAIQIITKLSFNINDLSIIQEYEKMEQSLNNTLTWCNEYKDILIKNFEAVSLIKKDLKKIEDFKKKMEVVNIFIAYQYGLKIIKINKPKDIKDGKYQLYDKKMWQDEIKLRPLTLETKTYEIYKKEDILDEGVPQYLLEE